MCIAGLYISSLYYVASLYTENPYTENLYTESPYFEKHVQKFKTKTQPTPKGNEQANSSYNKEHPRTNNRPEDRKNSVGRSKQGNISEPNRYNNPIAIVR